MSLPEKCVDMVRKLIPRLASNHDGEVVATAHAIERTLKTHGASYHELSAAIAGGMKAESRSRRQSKQEHPDGVGGDIGAKMVRDAAHELLRMKWLDEKETEFVVNMSRKTTRPGFKMTPKQWGWFQRICGTYGVQI